MVLDHVAPHRLEETVERGICIGCGVCEVATDCAIKLSPGPERLLLPVLTGVDPSHLRRASLVCPFSDDAPTVEQLGPGPCASGAMVQDERIGPHLTTYAGRVNDEGFLLGSSSGGLTTWTLQQLVENDHIDAVIHVGGSELPGRLFEERVSTSGEIEDHRKSHYYATTLTDVLRAVKGDARRFALVGVPCFIRAARSLCVIDDVLASRLVLFVGLVCGHMKSPGFAESLAWQVGVPPAELGAVDFRLKDSASVAGSYDFGARATHSDRWQTKKTSTLVGGNWGHGAFQPKACNYCDDVFAETADVSFGDAWLPAYASDWRGTNIVVCRNPLIDAILIKGCEADEITLDCLSVDDAAASQAGGLRHRRDGLAVRLYDDVTAGLSVPSRRVRPSVSDVTATRARLIRKRVELSAQSHILFARAKEEGDLDIYLDGMGKLIRQYRRLEANPYQRVRRTTRAALRRMWRTLARSRDSVAG